MMYLTWFTMVLLIFLCLFFPFYRGLRLLRKNGKPYIWRSFFKIAASTLYSLYEVFWDDVKQEALEEGVPFLVWVLGAAAVAISSTFLIYFLNMLR